MSYVIWVKSSADALMGDVFPEQNTRAFKDCPIVCRHKFYGKSEKAADGNWVTQMVFEGTMQEAKDAGFAGCSSSNQSSEELNAWYADPANRNPDYKPEMTAVSLANSNFCWFMEEVLDPMGDYSDSYCMPIDRAIQTVEAWLAQHPVQEEFRPSGVGMMVAANGVSQPDREDDPNAYLSYKADELLRMARIGKEHGAQVVTWG